MQNLPKFDDPRLLIGAEGFSDAGVFRVRDDLLLVQSLDFFPPLVDDPFVFGQIAAANSLSDLYAMGATPLTALNIVGYPDDQLDLQPLGEILRGGAERVKAAGAVVAGGHTVRDAEIKFGLSVTGVVQPARLMTNRNAQPGDRLVLTKALGTGFVTTAFKAQKCPDEVFDGAVDSMVQLNDVASRLAGDCGVRAATDVTGFGLAGHAHEMAEASDVTCVINVTAVPLLVGVPELAKRGFVTRANATNRSYLELHLRVMPGVDPAREAMLYDPQTSGGLLLSVPADVVETLLVQLHQQGISAARLIGEVHARSDVRLEIR